MNNAYHRVNKIAAVDERIIYTPVAFHIILF